jgi:hypothetical protein
VHLPDQVPQSLAAIAQRGVRDERELGLPCVLRFPPGTEDLRELVSAPGARLLSGLRLPHRDRPTTTVKYLVVNDIGRPFDRDGFPMPLYQEVHDIAERLSYLEGNPPDGAYARHSAPREPSSAAVAGPRHPKRATTFQPSADRHSTPDSPFWPPREERTRSDSLTAPADIPG